LIAEAVFRNYHGLVGALPLGTQSCVFGSCRRASESEIANVPDAVGATRKHYGAAGSRSPAEISHDWLEHRPLRGVSDRPASLGNRSCTPRRVDVSQREGRDDAWFLRLLPIHT
jgi:hypothetical protein